MKGGAMDKKEQTRLRVQRYRDKQKALQGGENVTLCDVTQGADVTPQMSYEELRESLQWGIDTGRIRCRGDVVEYYGLTPRFGPNLLTKEELRDKLNVEIKDKKIDAPLYFLGDDDTDMSGVRYSYSKDWYK